MILFEKAQTLQTTVLENTIECSYIYWKSNFYLTSFNIFFKFGKEQNNGENRECPPPLKKSLFLDLPLEKEIEKARKIDREMGKE